MKNPRLVPGCILALGLLGAACSEEGNRQGGEFCRTGTYVLNPSNGPAYTLTEDYRFRCTDSSFAPELQHLYESCADTGSGVFSFYSGGLNIGFQAIQGEYRFVGSVVREFGSGVGAFASGAYERTSGGTIMESGTFEFTEGDIQLPGTLECTP